MRSSIERELDLSPHTYYSVTVTKSLLIYLAVSSCGMWDLSFGCSGFSLVAVLGLSCPASMWGPSSPTRDWTHIPWIERQILNHWYVCAQSCLTLCNLVDCCPPGFSVLEIFQARILKWVAISFSRGFSWPRNQTHVSCLTKGLFTTKPPGKHLSLSEWSEVAQSCPTLCDPMDYSLSGSSVHGFFQARILEWVAIAFSRFT